MSGFTALVSIALLIAALSAAREAEAAPFAWAYVSIAIWTVWLMSKGWNALNAWEKVHLFWGVSSIVALCNFTRATMRTSEPFEGWSDIYYFCGQDYRYCRCDFTWNLAGWGKALVLWNFVVTASLGLQKLVIHCGLNGLLPGEEVVTKESLVSFCWRLIPYWLNSWEQQWGAECSSVMFELPHFALELLVVLPCVQVDTSSAILALYQHPDLLSEGCIRVMAVLQIMASRLKILLMPPGRGLVPPFDQATPADASSMAPVIMAGVWEERKADGNLKHRIRANFRVLVLLVSISALAACNALYVPLRLEQVIHTHPRSIALLQAAEADGWLNEYSNVTASEDTYSSAALVSMVAHFDAKGCQNQNMLASNLVKHASEISKMQGPNYRDLTMCVEAALTIMRLSCEQYFTLMSVFAAYLLFRQHPPVWARHIIWVNHRFSTMFSKTILYSFPAICWLYGAGFMFSSFASFVFWGQPIAQLWEFLRAQLTVVQPVGLQEATQAQIEQMNGKCAVCWAPMTAAGGTPPLSSDSNLSSSSAEDEEEEHNTSSAGPQPAQQQQHQPQGFMQVPCFPFDVAHGQDHTGQGPAEQEKEEEEDTTNDSCKALPCGHAFHTGCIAKWLQQCHVQSRQVTCPMCNLVIKLEVTFRLHRTWSWAHGVPVQPPPPAAARNDTDASQQAAQAPAVPAAQASPSRGGNERQSLCPVNPYTPDDRQHHQAHSWGNPEASFRPLVHQHLASDDSQVRRQLHAVQQHQQLHTLDNNLVGSRPLGRGRSVHQDLNSTGTWQQAEHQQWQQDHQQRLLQQPQQIQQPQHAKTEEWQYVQPEEWQQHQQQHWQQHQQHWQQHQQQHWQQHQQHWQQHQHQHWQQHQQHWQQHQEQHWQQLQQHHHHQQQQQQQQQVVQAAQWQPGLSTYQALQRLQTSPEAPSCSFLQPSPAPLHRQNSDPLQRRRGSAQGSLLHPNAVPLQLLGSSCTPSWRTYQHPLQYANSRLEVARVSHATRSMQQGDVALSDRRTMQHETPSQQSHSMLSKWFGFRRRQHRAGVNRTQTS